MHFIRSVPVFYANENHTSVGLTRVQIKESLSIENLTVKFLEGRGEERERRGGGERRREERESRTKFKPVFILYLICQRKDVFY